MKKNFILKIINYKLIKNLNFPIVTRFAPEPSGVLHLGHLKCIYINYNIAKIYNGTFFLRIDDSNIKKKKQKYCKNILKLLKEFKINFYYSSSIKFFNLYIFAKKIIKFNKAYIDSQKYKQFKKNKGTFKIKAKTSVFKKRSIKENIYLFKKMYKKKFKEKEMFLRMKIKKTSNINIRDPIIFRIKSSIACPTYDFSNSILDRIDYVTFSICTKEFENNKNLYLFYIKLYNNITNNKFFPKQIEFSKLKIKNYNLSKRKIKRQIKKNNLKWNNVNLLTVCGLKKRGYSIKKLILLLKNNTFSKNNCVYNIKQIFKT
ncbi:glutamate--tRNA ligase family protein [Candidatus Vidania fulgoroideorum]